MGRPRAALPPPEGHRVPRAIREEIERVENEEALARKLSREMHDFFEDARRMAADILSHVHDDTAEKSENVSEQMHEFLHHAAGRVQEFKESLAPVFDGEPIEAGPKARIRIEEPEETIEPSDESDHDHHHHDDELFDGIETLVTLSGEAHDDSQHFGNDTWSPPEDGAGHPRSPVETPADPPANAPADPAPLDFAMELESVLESDLGETLTNWCTRLAHEDRKLRDALKHLVHEGFMDKREAMTIYETARRALD